jgi:hypothetical protein
VGRPRLVAVDDNGEVAPPCHYCQTGEEHPETCEKRAALLQEVESLAARIRQMKRDRDAEREQHPQRALIEELHAFWQDRCGHPKATLRGDRHDAWASLLDKRRGGYSRERIMCMIVGMGAYRFEQYGRRFAEEAPGRTRRDEPEYLAAKAKRQDDLALLGWRWLRENGEELPPVPEAKLKAVKNEAPPARVG